MMLASLRDSGCRLHGHITSIEEGIQQGVHMLTAKKVQNLY